MDEEEELKNALIGQNPMMAEQPVINTRDQILDGVGAGLLELTTTSNTGDTLFVAARS